jgi:hypothetical protein
MSKSKLKLVKSDGERSFIRKLADLIVQEVNAEYGNDNVVTVHLINAIMNMIETEIYYSKYSKNKFDKKKILYLVLNKCFNNKYTDENDTIIEDAIRYIIDNKLIKLNKKNLFVKYGRKVLKLGLDFIM